MCVNCKTRAARPDSIYCSDACRREFLTFPEYAKRTLAGRGCTHPTTVVERWNGAEWLEVKLTWTGSKYEEIN
jgi:hypothetical protein